MSSPEQRLSELGLVPSGPFPIPEGMSVPLSFVRVHGNRVMVAGHGPQAESGVLIPDLLGKVGKDLTLEQGVEAARYTALAMLGSLQRELGSLDRIDSWVRVFGMVNATDDFTQHTPVINGFSELMIDVFGESARCVRCAVGMSSLPLNIPVEIEAELLLRS
jgi:enamine deaminase RidA (YjgF/YER057c/UK114 family)